MQSDLPPDSTTPSAMPPASDPVGSATPSVDDLAGGHAADAQVHCPADRAAHRPVLVGASALGGCVVFASDGESVGVVTEVIVDVAGRVGQIAYVLVAPKHPAVGQSELRALPWSALLFNPARHCFTLEVSSAVVRNAPETISKGWPIMPDQQWKTDVHRYYHPTEADTPSTTQVGIHGHAPGPIESPVPGLTQAAAQAPARASVQAPAEPPVAVPIEPPPGPDTKSVEHDFLPELGLTSPLRRREPDPK
jgi:hypothetical protein